MDASLLVPSLFIFGWIIFWAFSYAAPRFHAEPGAGSVPTPIESGPARKQFYAIALCASLLYTAGFWNITPAPLSPAAPMKFALLIFYIGILLAMSASWSIRFLSFKEMVASFSRREVHAGPYRYIRHPMYAGMALTFFGSLLAYPTVIGAIAFGAIAAIFLMRAAAENRAFIKYGSPNA